MDLSKASDCLPHSPIIAKLHMPMMILVLTHVNFCPVTYLIEVQWRHLATWIWVNIDSGNGLLSDGTKLLPEPMLTYHQ